MKRTTIRGTCRRQHKKRVTLPRERAQSRSRKLVPRGPSHPALDLAMQFDMLTDEEIELCLKDQAKVEGSELLLKTMKASLSHPPRPTLRHPG